LKPAFREDGKMTEVCVSIEIVVIVGMLWHGYTVYFPKTYQIVYQFGPGKIEFLMEGDKRYRVRKDKKVVL